MSKSKIVKTIKLTESEWRECRNILDNGLDEGFYADALVQGPEHTEAYNQLMEKLGDLYEQYILKEEV